MCTPRCVASPSLVLDNIRVVANYTLPYAVITAATVNSNSVAIWYSRTAFPKGYEGLYSNCVMGNQTT